MEVKTDPSDTYHLRVTGTQSYTLSTRPSRTEWTCGSVDAERGEFTIVGRRKPRLRWWRELLIWHVWRRWRKTRIRTKVSP